jgi:mRNA interferase MazF
MRQQDLVWVRLPFSDRRGSKFRPAVVISHDTYNRRSQDIVVCAITSNLRPAEHKIAISQRDLSSGRLPRKSMVRVDKVLHVEKTLIERTFARLSDVSYDAVVERLTWLVRRAA